MTTFKSAARALCPPLVWNALGAAKRGGVQQPRPPQPPTPTYGHLGHYASFRDARSVAGDYQADAILEVTIKGTGPVQHRDLSILDARLLAALQFVLPQSPARILDFGGALGSHYFSMSRFLGERIASWTVVELPHQVGVGSKLFADGCLRFSDQLEDADVVIASGALQYSDDPYGNLATLRKSARRLILDKVPLLPQDRWTVQHIDPRVFGVLIACPAFFFGEEKLRAAAGAPLMEWPMPDYQALLDGERQDVFRGFVL